MNNEAFTTTFVVLGEVSNGIDSVKDVRTELIYRNVCMFRYSDITVLLY
jgi:hypothetical protein